MILPPSLWDTIESPCLWRLVLLSNNMKQLQQTVLEFHKPVMRKEIEMWKGEKEREK